MVQWEYFVSHMYISLQKGEISTLNIEISWKMFKVLTIEMPHTAVGYAHKAKGN